MAETLELTLAIAPTTGPVRLLIFGYNELNTPADRQWRDRQVEYILAKIQGLSNELRTDDPSVRVQVERAYSAFKPAILPFSSAVIRVPGRIRPDHTNSTDESASLQELRAQLEKAKR